MSPATAEKTETVDTTGLQKESTDITVQAKALVILTDTDFERAAGMLVRIEKARKAVGETLDPIIKKAHEAHKEALTQKKRLEDPLAVAASALRTGMIAYKDVKDREAARLAAEREAAAKKQAEEERLALAATLEDQGRTQEAEAVVSAPITVAPMRQAVATPKVDGVGFRQVWKAEVFDLLALVKAVADGKAPLAYLVPNQTALDGIARSLKDAAQAPGVRFYSTTSSAVRA